MCKRGNSVQISINEGETIRLDKCMAHLIFTLSLHGIHTLGCCCGHDKYPMTVVINDDGVIKDLISGQVIPRTKRFYARDKKGDLYIPEVLKLKS